MAKKILCWMGSDFTHFCLTNYLEKMIDAEYFAIVDITNKPKSFFENQKLVKFKKIWFFHDYISKKNGKPNLEYLHGIEKKINVNIWKLALNERLFFNFYDFHKFTSNEILSIDEQACRLFEKILDEVKPDFFITKQPALHHLELFYQMCRAKGVKVLMLNNSNFGSRSIIVEDISKFDNNPNLDNFKPENKTFEENRRFQKELKKNIDVNLITKNRSLSYSKSALKFLSEKNINQETNYNYFGRTKFKVLKSELKYNIKLKIRKNFINKKLTLNPNLRTKFIFFPMSLDMERSTLIDAPYHTNQIEVIRSIAKSIPANQKLYVKEHPSQYLRGWREISDYNSIMKIPNVILIHPEFSSEKLYQKCSLVITISGTAGFEAALYEKPSIILNQLRYSILPSVHKLKSFEELPSVINNSIETKVNIDDINRYVKLLESVTIEFNWLEFQQKFQKEFYFNDTFRDAEISESKLKKFLEQNKNILEQLAKDHVKKMNELENNSNC